MRLLLAEDEWALAKALAAILERNNYSVDVAYDGEVALEYLQADNYDGVILDIMMPKVDGITVPRAQAADSFLRGTPLPVRSQIADEIEYFRAYYGDLRPVVFLSYERQAFCEPGGALRVTFDENILCRGSDFSLDGEIYGVPLLEEGQTLMEIKTPGASRSG